MNKYSKLFTISLLSLAITSCDLLGGLTGKSKNYSNYEDYFTQELKYEKSTDMASFNKAVDEGAYWWRTYEGKSSITYYSEKNWSISFNNKEDDKTASSIYFLDGNRIYFYEKDGKRYFQDIDYTCTDGETYWLLGSSIAISEEKQKQLQVHKYEDNSGYLVLACEKYMFYINADFTEIYVNEKNTKTFTNINGSKEIQDCELLTTYLAANKEDNRLTLPAPEGKNIEIWHGKSYYKEQMSHYTAYLADVEPAEYAETLKKNGYTVIRSYEDPFYAFYTTDGGYWYCYDEKAEVELLITANHYLYVDNMGKSYGPFHNTLIWFYKMNKGYFGEDKQNSKEDWTDSDKETMNSWYDGKLNVVIPFVKLGTDYSMPNQMTRAHEGLLDGTLSQDQKCYNIYDRSKVYYLDGYDQVLEANGYHKYEYGFDVTSNYSARGSFTKTEDCKYAECYINTEKNVAIKYYFDVNNGNTIRVFKLDEMKSFNSDNY